VHDRLHARHGVEPGGRVRQRQDVTDLEGALGHQRGSLLDLPRILVDPGNLRATVRGESAQPPGSATQVEQLGSPTDACPLQDPLDQRRTPILWSLVHVVNLNAARCRMFDSVVIGDVKVFNDKS
jgi:hypothetical protein